jgi:sortase A
MRRYLTYLLFLLAGFSLWQGGWIEAKAWLAQALIDQAWESSETAEDRVRPWSWADTWPVAKLKVTRLDVDQTILAGVSGRTLAFGPGWSEQTTMPGGAGRSLIAGHRDTHFHFIQHLVAGDQLIVERSNGQRVHYRVSETVVVHESAAWLMGETTEQELLLVTCYPFDAIVPGGELRYVVRAEAESVFPQEAETG